MYCSLPSFTVMSVQLNLPLLNTALRTRGNSTTESPSDWDHNVLMALWIFPSSWMWCRTACYVGTNVLEKTTVSITESCKGKWRYRRMEEGKETGATNNTMADGRPERRYLLVFRAHLYSSSACLRYWFLSTLLFLFFFARLSLLFRWRQRILGTRTQNHTASQPDDSKKQK
jgi:hypothetical protein